mgnify:CR=1 FL=1
MRYGCYNIALNNQILEDGTKITINENDYVTIRDINTRLGIIDSNNFEISLLNTDGNIYFGDALQLHPIIDDTDDETIILYELNKLKMIPKEVWSTTLK